jgi:hypothetical protein
MTLFQVRIFIANRWNVIRTYSSHSEALDFAQLLSTEWDIKEVSLEEANKMVNA